MKKVLKVIIVLVIVYSCFILVQSRNFNGLKVARIEAGVTKVSRDYFQQYNGEWSYKIESKNYNDYMLYKTIKVNKNTAYKLTCMAKTENVEPEYKNAAGFNICLKDTLEKSDSINGTNEWTQVTLYFNSKDNEEVDIGFRLGDINQKCKGTVWIADIELEVGRQKKTNEWDIAFFLVKNTEVGFKGEIINENLDEIQVSAIKNCITTFKDTIADFTEDNIIVNNDIIEIDKPLTTLSCDEETGCYVSEEDAYDLIDEYLHKGKIYDHIFIITNIGQKIRAKEIEWLGLGGMMYNTMGYSNIRISDESINSYITSYYNYFPEEIILHEFLHTLERNSIRFGYETIALHDFQKYGYKNEARYGLRSWYDDYVSNSIKNTNNGIRNEIYHTQPVSSKNFIKMSFVTEKIYNEQNLVHRILEKISRIL